MRNLLQALLCKVIFTHYLHVNDVHHYHDAAFNNFSQLFQDMVSCLFTDDGDDFHVTQNAACKLGVPVSGAVLAFAGYLRVDGIAAHPGFFQQTEYFVAKGLFYNDTYFFLVMKLHWSLPLVVGLAFRFDGRVVCGTIP